ncbi:MAG: gfo/Idh/MocA family oxidoreductase [Proteobacteria bacterium]|nr:gfo/Idh/MocA family oxidoreductase [Pseudomonadota bacterium]
MPYFTLRFQRGDFDSGIVSKPTKPVRLGIVGCGAVTREMHLPAFIQSPSIEVTYLCDRVTKNTALAKEEYVLPDARVTAEVKDFAGHVDAAVVAVPPKFHAPVTCELLAMGIDVLCEKPIALSTAEARLMSEAARKHGRILAVGLMTRFHRNTEVFRRIVNDPLIGEIQEVIAEAGSVMGWIMTSDAYFNKKLTLGGAFFDSGVHLVDRVVDLFGDVSDIAYEDDSFGGVECNANLTGKLSIAGRNVPCRMSFSWTHGLFNGIRVIGSHGTAEVKYLDPDAITVTRTVGGEPLELGVRYQGAAPNPYLLQIEDFARAVRTRGTPKVTAEAAMLSLAVIKRAYAARTPMKQPWVEVNR